VLRDLAKSIDLLRLSCINQEKPMVFTKGEIPP
jgi:hypothetical protein